MAPAHSTAHDRTLVRGILPLVALACAAGPARAELPRSQQRWDIPVHEGVPWPIKLVPIDGALPQAPRRDAPAPPPPTRAAARVLGVVTDIQRTLVASKYQPSTRVNAKDGVYD